MPIYQYKANSKYGDVIDDTIQAANQEEAASVLRSQGMQILTIKSTGRLKKDFFSGGISVSDKANFCRFMATMIRSGMSIPEAVEIIKEEATSKKLKKVLTDISYQTRKGKSLSSVFSMYPDDFDQIFLTMIKAGEESGTLEKSFDYLAKQLAANHELSQKVKGSLMYPAVIVVAMFGNGLMMALFVLPRISGVFLKLDIPLPTYTRIVLGMGEFFGNNSLLVLIGVVVMGALTVGAFFFKPTRKLIMSIITSLPVVKKVAKHIDVARFARTLSTLLKNGVPIIEALDVSAQTISQKRMREQAELFSKQIAKGESLSAILVGSKKIFPPIMVQTIKAGEKTGNMEQVLEEMAEFYEKEVDFSLKRLTSLLEPVLMLVIGVAVGVMVIIMIAPIYSIIGGLQQTIQGQ